MKILVTGALGHVGLATVRAANRRGHEVIALHRAAATAEHHASAGPGVRFIRTDLTDAAGVDALAAEHHVDACIHAAAVSNEAYAKVDPLRAVSTNVAGTANLLDAARRYGWRRLVFVSTGSVFQAPHDISQPILEDAAPTPLNVYGTTKTAAELIVRMYRSQFNVSAATVRISWVFGPPIVSTEPTRGPIPSFIIRALRQEPIREGGADFAASFTYIADVADGLVAAAEAPVCNYDTYHLGHGVNFPLSEVADAVRTAIPGAGIELTGGTEPWTRFTSLRGALAGTRFSDDTGYVPRHDLHAGIRAYAAWLRDRPDLWR
jgi:nucleoside-diphosphate-sugar epimerase